MFRNNIKIEIRIHACEVVDRVVFQLRRSVTGWPLDDRNTWQPSIESMPTSITVFLVFPSPLPKWDKFFTRNPCARTTIDAEKNPERAINNLRYCGNPVETVA